MQKILTKISMRELVLLIILVVVVVALIVVNGPSKADREALDAEYQDVKIELETKQTMIDSMAGLKAKTDAAKAAKGSSYTGLADYNNVNKVIQELNEIFGDTDNYSVTFGDEELSGGLVIRPVQVRFAADSKPDAISRLEEVKNSKYQYLITDMSMSGPAGNAKTSSDTSSAWTVMLMLTVYEIA